MKTKIGFDFDKIFVSYPPIIPGFLIEYLYKKKNHNLSYRIPGKVEQKIRVLSHTPIFRRPIKSNIDALKKIFDSKEFKIYLISSRFSFLKKRTDDWNHKHKLSSFFENMYFNFDDKQPHIFKKTIIKKEGIQKFVDDDLDLLRYLAKENEDVQFYWLSDNHHLTKLPENIKKIKNLEEFRIKYL